MNCRKLELIESIKLTNSSLGFKLIVIIEWSVAVRLLITKRGESIKDNRKNIKYWESEALMLLFQRGYYGNLYKLQQQ